MKDMNRFRDALSKLDACLKALDGGGRLSAEESDEGRRLLRDILGICKENHIVSNFYLDMIDDFFERVSEWKGDE